MAQFNSLIVTGGARFLNTIKGTIENSEKVGGHSTPASGNASSDQVVLGNDTRLTNSRTPTSHTHGNIQNGGTLQTNDITIASGDKIVVTDSSDSAKVARTSISFDGSTTTKALTQKGTWETFGTSNLTLGTTSTTALKGDTKYAGSSSAGGSATSAVKLDTTTAGSATQPCYFADGVPSACTYSLNKTVPSNAVFTDTNNAVTQTATATENNSYCILFSASADSSTKTEGARKSGNLLYNPSTKALSNYKISLYGNTGEIIATKLNGATIGSDPKFTDTTYESKASASGGTAVSLCTTGEKYTWNSKLNSSGAITRDTFMPSTTTYSADNLRGGARFLYYMHGVPYTGTTVSFDSSDNENYSLQLNANYGASTGNARFSFRTRNGDRQEWSNWLECCPVHRFLPRLEANTNRTLYVPMEMRNGTNGDCFFLVASNNYGNSGLYFLTPNTAVAHQMIITAIKASSYLTVAAVSDDWGFKVTAGSAAYYLTIIRLS